MKILRCFHHSEAEKLTGKEYCWQIQCLDKIRRIFLNKLLDGRKHFLNGEDHILHMPRLCHLNMEILNIFLTGLLYPVHQKAQRCIYEDMLKIRLNPEKRRKYQRTFHQT